MAVATYVTLVVTIRYTVHYVYRVFLYFFPPLPVLCRQDKRRQVLRQRKQDSRARRINGQRTWLWRSYVSFIEKRHRKEPMFSGLALLKCEREVDLK